MLAHPQPSLWRAGWDWSLLRLQVPARWVWDASLPKLCLALSMDTLHLDGDKRQVKSLAVPPAHLTCAWDAEPFLPVLLLASD